MRKKVVNSRKSSTIKQNIKSNKKASPVSSIKLVDMKCSKCGAVVHRVDSDTISVICYMCTCKMAPAPKIAKERKISDKPRGWTFMAKYVHKDGTVYFRGIEQPDLKGKFEPTDLVKLSKKREADKKKNKELKRKREEKREAKLVKEHKERASLKEKKRKEKIKKIEELKNGTL